MMRTYSPNSPEAAGRVLAMALLSDGHCSSVELDTLQRVKAAERLGLTPDGLRDVINGFAQDMWACTPGELPAFDRIDEPTRLALLNDITDAYLRVELQALSHELVQADGHLADGEALLIDTLWSRWQSEHVDIGTGDGHT